MMTTIQTGLYFIKADAAERYAQMRTDLRQHLSMNKNTPGTYGERLRSARRARGLKQTQLEKLSGVSQQVISSLEGNKQDATAYTVRLSAALGVNPEWLESGAGEKNPTPWHLLLDVSALDQDSQGAAKDLVGALMTGAISREKFIAIVNLSLSDIKRA